MEREFITKVQTFGVPISWANLFFRKKFKQLRELHKEFDEYLIELKKLIENEHKDYLKNFITFINGEGYTNWYSASDGLLTIIIRLYNYGLSPKQTLDYIKQCHKHYLKLQTIEYEIYREIEIYEKKSRYDSKIRRFVEVSLYPKEYIGVRFELTISEIIFVSKINDITLVSPDISFKIIGEEHHTKDALMLFEYDQIYDGFIKMLVTLVIQKLIDSNIFKLKKKLESSFENGYEYEVLKPIGRYLVESNEK